MSIRVAVASSLQPNSTSWAAVKPSVGLDRQCHSHYENER